jgi:hypothetical protein
MVKQIKPDKVKIIAHPGNQSTKRSTVEIYFDTDDIEFSFIVGNPETLDEMIELLQTARDCVWPAINWPIREQS